MGIYTKTGDKGQTSLWNGQRLDKNHPRICLLGEIDELTTSIGVAKCHVTSEKIKSALHKVQEELIVLMGELADHEPSKGKISKDHVIYFEEEIDKYMADSPFKGFTVPGEHKASAFIEMSRVTTRKVERRLYEVAKDIEVSDAIKEYINRLSDFLYALARYQNKLLSKG